MINSLKHISTTLEKKVRTILLALSLLVFGGLTYYSMRYTEISRLEVELPSTAPDNELHNICFFAGLVALFFLLRMQINKKISNFSNNTYHKIIACVTLLVLSVSLIWVTICHVTPNADGASLCHIAQIIVNEKDYGFMTPPGYMSYNPHQYSLLAIIQILFQIFNPGNYFSFQCLNALCMPLLFYSGYKLLFLICQKWEPVLYYIVFFLSFLPVFFYIPFVYGEITSTTFTLVTMWQVIRYCKTEKKSCFFWGTLFMVLGCVMRMNSLIVLIATGIVLLFYFLRTAKLQVLIWIVTMVIAVFATDAGIRAHYERVSDYEVSDGIPYISYILMGLEDSEKGPGWFNGTNYTQLRIHDYDTKQTAIDNTTAVKERLRTFWDDKPYFIDFFRRKLLTQWNTPTCNSLFETATFDCEKNDLPRLVQSIYYDKYSSISSFMNLHQFLIYICVTILICFCFFNSSSNWPLENYILLIAVIGGFLFTIIWEAKSRYILPYIVYLIPLAAIGMWQLQEKISKLINKVNKK